MHIRRLSGLTPYFLLVALVVAPRLTYLVASQTYALPAGYEMDRAARGLAVEGDLANVYSPDSGPTAHVLPLYPLGLSLVYRLFGVDAPVSRLLEQLLDVLAVAGVALLLPGVARTAGASSSAGWAAAFLVALSPFHFWLELLDGREHVYAALLLTALLGASAGLQRDGWRSAAQAAWVGVLLGAMGLLNAAVFLAGLGMTAAAAVGSRSDRLLVLKRGAVVAVVVLALFAPWWVRNYRALGGFVPLRSNFGLELRIGNNPFANGRTFGGDDRPDDRIAHMHPYLDDAQREHCREVGELAYMREQQNLALAWIAGHPGEFVALTARRCWLFWASPPELWGPEVGRREFRSLLFGLLYGLGPLAGLVVLFVRRHPGRWLWLAAIVGPSLPYLVTHVDLRYHYPTMALSTVLTCDVLLRVGQLAARRLLVFAPWFRRAHRWLLRRGQAGALPVARRMPCVPGCSDP